MRINGILALFTLFVTVAQALPGSSERAICDVDNAAHRSKSIWIGKDKNVEVYTVSCPTDVVHNARELQGLNVRQFSTSTASTTAPAPTTTAANVCGAQCNTNCFTPSGGGPDPNECHVITDALLFASENTGNVFPISPSPANTLVMQYRSCKTFFLNQASGSLAYCRSDWASLVDFLAFNCQATQNAHGGNCVAQDGRWFVQVQHV